MHFFSHSNIVVVVYIGFRSRLRREWKCVTSRTQQRKPIHSGLFPLSSLMLLSVLILGKVRQNITLGNITKINIREVHKRQLNAGEKLKCTIKQIMDFKMHICIRPMITVAGMLRTLQTSLNESDNPLPHLPKKN